MDSLNRRIGLTAHSAWYCSRLRLRDRLNISFAMQEWRKLPLEFQGSLDTFPPHSLVTIETDTPCTGRFPTA
jgi:hypothetical protein